MKKMIILIAVLLSPGYAKTDASVHKGIKMPHMEFPMKEGKGMYAVKGMCNMCHSWGYTINQGPQSKAYWRKKVLKMIEVFHAPIRNEDIEVAVEYLFENYGNGKEN